MTKFGAGFILAIVFCSSLSQAAPVLPGPADIERVKPENKELQIPAENDNILPEASSQPAQAPEGAEKIQLTLKEVKIEGATAFTEAELKDIYEGYIGKTVTLDIAWKFAAEITERYHKAGYFLSRAYIPAQEIESGSITIIVVEGYIGEVTVPESVSGERIVEDIVANIKKKKPLDLEALEEQLLLLNDLPGISFMPVLQPIKDGDEGAVRLVLTSQEKPQQFSIGADNLGSRYLGPYETFANWQGSLLPLQETSLAGIMSLPADELKSVSGTHNIVISPKLKLELQAGYTTAEPGYTLRSQDIKSMAVNTGVKLSYQFIRQRQENLELNLGVDGRNSNSDILGAPLTRDRIRTARLQANYDVGDAWYGYNYLSATVSHGLSIFGASDKNDPDLSRDDAKPNYTKAEFSFTRLQGITKDWSGVFASSGQVASGSLFSSEEYGYGGIAFGRAYDTSEISGDHGLSGSLELRYGGLPSIWDMSLVPYGFYDIGQVWNENPGQERKASGSSAGLGLRFFETSGLTGNIAVAAPLTKEIDAPIYGKNPKNPRFILQLTYGF